MVKAIFFDIDGTLVSFNTHKIPESTMKALKDLKEQGIKIFIATGRGKDGLECLKGIEFDGYITLNGQYCFTKDNVLFENSINKDDIQSLLNYVTKNPMPVGFTLRDTKYFNFRDERVDAIHAITHNDNHPAKDCSDISNHNIYQCMVFCNDNEEKELLKVMPHCHSARWHDLFTDVSPLGGSKQHGIDVFLNYYGIDLNETMAFGDGGNDIPMLKHVQTSIAMGNGKDEVKKICDYVTDSVDNDGIVNALKHYDLL